MTLMVTHLLLLLKGHFNAFWMFKGRTVIKPTVYRLQISMVGLGQREDTLIQDCLEYKLTQLIGECVSKILRISHIMTQKFQRGKHTIRKIITMEENKDYV